MEKISFKTFCKKMGYGPDSLEHNTFSSLAAQIGVSVSYVSRLYSEEQVTEKQGDSFNSVKEFMTRHGFELDYLPATTREKLQKQVVKSTKDNIFNITLQKEYTKLNNKYDSLVQSHRDLEKKYRELEKCYMNTISEEEANKLREEIKFYKQKFIDLNNLVAFAKWVGEERA